MEVLGKPSKEVMSIAKRKHLFFDEQENIIIKPNSWGKIRIPNSKSIANILKS